MQGETTTLGAPILLLGLLLGFFLCFYGYRAKRLFIKIRSAVAGALVATAAALFFHARTQVLAALQTDHQLHELWLVISNPADYSGLLLYLLACSAGALALFFLARNAHPFLDTVVAFFTAVSMDLLIFLLIIPYLPLSVSIIISLTLLVVILAFSLIHFTSYLAIESALAGSLLVSYLLSRFWYLGFWIFFGLWALLAFLGILNQLHMLTHRESDNA
ncbi:hypothetical protein [Sphaerochaeta sp.]|uniref:hypothetical protein n=1 Tax=Sphaerochaeta sp. TaxID=1972642 RepID=UPI002FC9E907